MSQEEDKHDEKIAEIIELLSVGVGLNHSGTSEFRPGRCVLKSLKRLHRIIVKDENKKVILHLAKTNIVKTCLIPAFSHFILDEEISSVLVEIFFLITEPLDEETNVASEFDYYSSINKFKSAMFGADTLTLITRLFAEILCSFIKKRTEILADSLEVYLCLFRNLCYTFDFNLGNDYKSNLVLHDQTISCFKNEGVLKSLILLSNVKFNNNTLKLAYLVQEIFYNIVILEDFSSKTNNVIKSDFMVYDNSKDVPLLERLRMEEKRKNVSRRNSNWASQYSFVLPGNKKILTSLVSKKPNKQNKNKTINNHKRVYTNNQAENAIRFLVQELIDSGGFYSLSKQLFMGYKNESKQVYKNWHRFLFFVSFCLYKYRTTFFQNLALKDWKKVYSKISICVDENMIRKILDILDEQVSKQEIKHSRIKWNRLNQIAIFLREITKIIYHGLKLSLSNYSVGDTDFKQPAIELEAAVLTLFYNNLIFKHVSFLLREYKENRNNLEHLKVLVELVHYIIALGKEYADTTNNTSHTNQFEDPETDIEQTKVFCPEEDEQSNLAVYFSKIPKFDLFFSHNFSKSLSPLCHYKISSNYMTLLSFYKTNSIEINDCIETYLKLVTQGLSKTPMLYSVLTLRTFSKILRDKKRDGFKRLCKEILNTFFDDLNVYPFLIVDCLFPMKKTLCEKILKRTYDQSDNEMDERDEDIEGLGEFVLSSSQGSVDGEKEFDEVNWDEINKASVEGDKFGERQNNQRMFKKQKRKNKEKKTKNKKIKDIDDVFDIGIENESVEQYLDQKSEGEEKEFE